MSIPFGMEGSACAWNTQFSAPGPQPNPGSPAGSRPGWTLWRGKTIGLYAHFKGHAIKILDEVARELSARFSGVTFTHFQYLKEITELIQDDAYAAQAAAWASGVDAVITAYGDAGSCSLFLAKNAAFFEKQGKPTVDLLCRSFQNSSKRRRLPGGGPACGW